MNESGIRWGVLVQHQSMLKYTDFALTLLSFEELRVLSEKTIDFIESNYEKFLLSPGADEALVYCDYDDAEDQNEAYRMKMGRPYNLSELHKFYESDFMHHHNEWRQGSIVISDTKLNDYAWQCFSSKQNK